MTNKELSYAVITLSQRFNLFKGSAKLKLLLEADEFWNKQPHDNRLYYGKDKADYLHKDILKMIVDIIEDWRKLMDVGEIKSLKNEVECDILEILRDFEEKTELLVNSIDLGRTEGPATNKLVRCRMSVKL